MRPLSFRQRLRMKYVCWSYRAGDDESVAKLMCCDKNVLEWKEIVARDAVTLGELETLFARAQVGVSLKAGFVADMEEWE
ncbi:hypothetical protein Tco_1394050 [Tanacetum coccineum]